ncbi:MAG: hypothetical protein N3A62_10525 [Thermodesulfovibrionales bacterium]|nr:hypothetical protein [Thermodesulfovibrionales bacterium]
MQSKIICYCFNHTEQDIIEDVVSNQGISVILQNITEQKRKGGCNCQWHHPEGR